MLFLDQSFCRCDSSRRVRSVVAVKGLDRPAEHAACLIDALKRELDAILLALPAVSVLSAQDGCDAMRTGSAARAGVKASTQPANTAILNAID